MDRLCRVRVPERCLMGSGVALRSSGWILGRVGDGRVEEPRQKGEKTSWWTEGLKREARQPPSIPSPTPVTISPPKRPQNPRREGTASTASHAGPSSARPANPSSTINPRIASPSFQPPYPSPSSVPIASPQPDVRLTTPTRWSLRNAFIGGGGASPFKNRGGRPRRPSGANPGSLWNPSNSTPRGPPKPVNKKTEDRAQIVPLEHPGLLNANLGQGQAQGGEYPLLTLPEQRQARHSGSTRASLQVERSSGGSRSVSLPGGVKTGSGEVSPTSPIAVDRKGKGRAIEPPNSPKTQNPTNKHIDISGLASGGKSLSSLNTDMDLERGPDPQSPNYPTGNLSPLPNNNSHTSLRSGIGPALTSSTRTSIIGSDGPPQDPAEEWGPQHPCFPHMNPHVPLSSPLYRTTRIIRIRRDWMVEGDLAPTFSNLYPEILDPAGVSEAEFRTLIETINRELIPAFSPWGVRNWVDGILGLLTGWLWDDAGLTTVKSRLSKVEAYIEEWNRGMEVKMLDKEMAVELAPRVVPLRRTGYMNLDIQVPDPEISYPTSIPPEERIGTAGSRPSQ